MKRPITTSSQFKVNYRISLYSVLLNIVFLLTDVCCSFNEKSTHKKPQLHSLHKGATYIIHRINNLIIMIMLQPNDEKTAKNFNQALVTHQIRYLG